MTKEQFLLKGGGFYYITHKSYIVYDLKLSELLKGSIVMFLWPERALHRKPYTGEIIECSKVESVLNNMLDELKNAKGNQLASRTNIKSNVDQTECRKTPKKRGKSYFFKGAS
ncbi:uncharacterized protein LOC117178907 [Belonocnema kinseyi]|uniref:uncharacterized protein LOC117178907 n=1 Tax=Belonocnema kinseyi TaxID=2817044 RepID=UPI00143DD8F3|nr:uncharacterized protein LOC117178907 [Belonocnema kinseyi]